MCSLSVPEISLGGGWGLDKGTVEHIAGFGGSRSLGWRPGAMEETKKVICMVLLRFIAASGLLQEPRRSPSSP